MKKRVLLKLSGEALKDSGDEIISSKTVDKIAIQVKELKNAGYDIAIVIGAGNIWRGASASKLGMDRVQADYMGMLATIMNSLALQQSLEKIGLKTRLMTAMEIYKVAEPYIRRRAERHFEKDRILILAGGTGSAYFSTDTASALRAAELNIPLILMAKNGTDGIYSKDPKKYNDAKKYDEITYQEILEKNLRVMDQKAASLCKENNIQILVFDMLDDNNIKKFIQGKKIGTLVKN